MLSQLRFVHKQVCEQLSRKASQYVQALYLDIKSDFRNAISVQYGGIYICYDGMHVISFGIIRLFFSFPILRKEVLFIVCALTAMFIWYLMSVLRQLLRIYSYLLNHLSIKLSFGRLPVLLILMVIFPNTLLVLSGQLSLLVSFLLIFIPNAKSKWQSLLFMQYLHILTAPFLFCVFFQWPILGGILTAVFSYLFTFLLLPYCFGLFLLTFIPPLLPFFNLPFDWIVKGIEYSLQFLVNFQLHFGTIPSWLVGICLILGLLFLQSSYHYLVPRLSVCSYLFYIFHLRICLHV